MKGKGDTADIDRYLTEIWSYLLYKKGKKMVGDVHPPSRIRKGIWRDEGLDVTEFRQTQSIESSPDIIDWMTESRKATVRKGLFRKKRTHEIITSLRPLMKETEPEDGEIRKSRNSTMAFSDILFPYLLHQLCSAMDETVPAIGLQRRPQIHPGDMSPDRMLGRDTVHTRAGDDTENIRKSFGRTGRGQVFRSPRGNEMNNLRDIFIHLMSCSEEELAGIIKSGTLVEFAAKGIKSDVFQALFRDLSTDPAGNEESPHGFRSRLGRWCMDSPLGDQIADEIIPLLLNRLMSCSEGEAMNLEGSLGTLMDPRSTGRITEAVFDSDPKKRQHLIRLLGYTQDRSARETLIRLRDLSNVERDRDSARDALNVLGFGE